MKLERCRHRKFESITTRSRRSAFSLTSFAEQQRWMARITSFIRSGRIFVLDFRRAPNLLDLLARSKIPSSIESELQISSKALYPRGCGSSVPCAPSVQAPPPLSSVMRLRFGAISRESRGKSPTLLLGLRLFLRHIFIFNLPSLVPRQRSAELVCRVGDRAILLLSRTLQEEFVNLNTWAIWLSSTEKRTREDVKI